MISDSLSIQFFYVFYHRVQGVVFFFFFSSRRRHTRFDCDWNSDVCSSDLQMQGGAVQGIGWALNEEYIYSAKGKIDNAGFLDYRMPVASDLPMIETIVVVVPNPHHP